MTARVNQNTRFPQMPMAAGAAPVANRQFVLGNEDLLSAITEKLGGSIPPGTTMKAKYDRDENSNAILTTVYRGKDKYDSSFFTFWRTFTVDVPGQGTFQFRKQIFTNVTIPENCGSADFQNRLEMAAIACSVFSKICNDAILVKGGGKSRLNLDEAKVDQIQKKAFIELGFKIGDLKDKKISSLAKIDAKVANTDITFNLNDVKPGKLTSIHSRHRKFAVDNPPPAYIKDRAKYVQKMLDQPVEFAKEYMDGGTSDSAKALKDSHEKRTNYKVIGEVKKSAVETARRLCSGDKHPTIRAGYVALGADIQKTIHDIKSYREYLVKEKPEQGWKRDWIKLKRQQSQLETKLRKMQNEWPGIFKEIDKEANQKAKIEHAKTPQFMQEAENANIHKEARDNFVSSKVAFEMAESHLKEIEFQIEQHKSKLTALNAEIAKGGKEELINPLQAQATALDQLIKVEEAKIEELKAIKEAAKEEEAAARNYDGTDDFKRLLTEGETKRIQAEAKFNNDVLKNAKEAFHRADRTVIAARKKIADDAAIAKKAVEDKHKKEAVDLNIHEPLHADYINKKIALDDAKAALEVKRQEVQALKAEHAKMDAEAKKPAHPPALKAALEKHTEAQQKLVEDAEKIVKISELRMEASELELKEIAVRGADEEFKKSGKPASAAQLNIDLLVGQKRAKLEQADLLSKEIKTSDLVKAKDEAGRAVNDARAQQANALNDAKAMWEAQINGLADGNDKEILKSVHEDILKSRENIASLTVDLRDNPAKIALLQANIAKEANPQVKAALQSQKTILEALDTHLKEQLKGDQALLDLAEEELFYAQEKGYALEHDRINQLGQNQAPHLLARNKAQFQTEKLKKQAELYQKIGQAQKNIEILGKQENALPVDVSLEALRKALEDERKYVECLQKLIDVNKVKLPKMHPNLEARKAWHQQWKDAVNQYQPAKAARDASATPILAKLAAIPQAPVEVSSDDEKSWENE